MDWNKSWKRSRKPGKQRKYEYNSPLHIRQKLISAHLSPELRKKYGRRSCGLRKDDKVKITRGQFKGKTGKIMGVNLKKCKVFVEGIENIRKEGTKAFYPLEPSNIIITELYMEDKIRKALLEKGKKPEAAKQAVPEKAKKESKEAAKPKKEAKKEQKNG